MAQAKNYSDLNQKGRHMKDQAGTENFDTNQSAQSMNAADEGSSANSGRYAGSETNDAERDTAKEGNSLTANASGSSGSDEDSRESKPDSYLNLVKQKAQDYWAKNSDQLTERYTKISDDVKLRGMMANDHIKNNTYAYAVGAVGLGFILGRAFSGKGKSDLDAVFGLVNKINFTKVAELFGYKADEVESPGSEEQRRKIG